LTGHQDYFHYLNQGENPTIDGVTDAEGFEETKAALSLLGFSQRELSDMFKVLAAILHLGNVTITEAAAGVGGAGDSEGSEIPVSSA
jgi:myosin-5